MSSGSSAPSTPRAAVDSKTFLQFYFAGIGEYLFAPIVIPTANELDFEIDFWQHVVRIDPDHFDALSLLGMLYTRRGDFARGLEVDRRLVTLQPCNPVCRYNLACSCSLLGKLDEAFEALRQAIDLGYDDLEHLETDPDLERLRVDGRYRHLVALLAFES